MKKYSSSLIYHTGILMFGIPIAFLPFATGNPKGINIVVLVFLGFLVLVALIRYKLTYFSVTSEGRFCYFADLSHMLTRGCININEIIAIEDTERKKGRFDIEATLRGISLLRIRYKSKDGKERTTLIHSSPLEHFSDVVISKMFRDLLKMNSNIKIDNTFQERYGDVEEKTDYSGILLLGTITLGAAIGYFIGFGAGYDATAGMIFGMSIGASVARFIYPSKRRRYL